MGRMWWFGTFPKFAFLSHKVLAVRVWQSVASRVLLTDSQICICDPTGALIFKFSNLSNFVFCEQCCTNLFVTPHLHIFVSNFSKIVTSFFGYVWNLNWIQFLQVLFWLNFHNSDFHHANSFCVIKHFDHEHCTFNFLFLASDTRWSLPTNHGEICGKHEGSVMKGV